MTEDLPFPKPEPIKFVPKLLKIGIEFKTDEYIRWEVEKRHYDLFNSMPRETRQQILNRWRHGGITIGEVAKEFKINSDVVNAIIFLNIRDIPLLRETSL
ncbi:hypothetical protein MUP79_03375 [Candidatus Bathyarchaeota archaeon]|nr:hypothetical protein [Candidatus Bathyarchaeota archaeon]